MKNIDGLIAAAYAPLNKEGELDLNLIGPYVKWLVQNNIKGAFINGSTGDFASLSTSERKLIIEEWGKCKPQGFILMAQVGHTSVKESKDMAQHASRHNVDAIAAISPYYFRPTTLESLVQVCESVAIAAPDLPFYFYHIPELAGSNFDMVRFLDLASRSIPNLRGLKYTQKDLVQFKCCLNYENGKYDILFGVDEILISGLALGAKAGVGSTYNHIAPLYYEIIRCFNNGELERAHQLQYKSMMFIKTLVKYGFSGASKATLKIFGLDLGPVRPPHRNLPPQELKSLEKELTKLEIFDWVHSKELL